MINIKRFVDINILHKEQSNVTSIRDTIVLLTNEGVAETVTTYSNLQEFITDKNVDIENPTTSGFPLSYAYINSFYLNGGNKVMLVEGITDTALALTSAINALANELIVVAYTGTQSYVKSAAVTRNQSSTIYGINRKLLLASTNASTDGTIDKDATSGLIYKYTEYPEDVMTIAAYLSNIDVYGINSVQDYCFTTEQSKTVIDNDDLFALLTAYNVNVDVRLANATRNYGGNCKDGLDLVNEFMLIVMQQTITDRILVALTSKLKNEEGLAIIKSVMTGELNRYVTNGYLNQSSVWTDRNYDVVYNGQSYTVIEQNEALLSGYKIKVLPYSSLSDEDKARRATPPIYIAIADSYGIRKVTINGVVFE